MGGTSGAGHVHGDAGAHRRFVGADGRKVSGTSEKKHQGLSIRHKSDHEYTIFPKAELIDVRSLKALVAAYAHAALGNGTGADLGDVLAQLTTVVVYSDSTIALNVLRSTTTALHQMSPTLPTSQRSGIIALVLSILEGSLWEALSYYESSADQYAQAGMLEHLVTEVNGDLVGAMLDTFCNLLLFTSVLHSAVAGDGARTTVVAFGEAHVIPLQILLDQLRGEADEAKASGEKK